MKSWPLLALAAIALSYALGLQIVRFERGFRQQQATSVTAKQPPVSHRKSAPPAAAGERLRWFAGYPCRDNCGEDKAGYRWARINHVVDPDDCTGTSGAFIEGCRVYAGQHRADASGDTG